MTSGAIAAGTARLGWAAGPVDSESRRRPRWAGALVTTSRPAARRQVAQVLLTQRMSHRERYLNARNTLMTLLGFRCSR